jgi:hypothetical protein
MLRLDVSALPSQAAFSRVLHLALGADSQPFLRGTAHLPRIVDLADAQRFLRDPYAQRHQRFAAFDQRAIRCARLLDAGVDQVAQLQQREPLTLDLEDQPLDGLLVAGAPPGAQFGERRGFEGRKTH